MSNLNTPRLDDGAKLSAAELDNVVRMSWPARRAFTGCTGACNQGRLPCRAPDACCMPIEDVKPYRGQRGISVYGVAALLLLVLSASFVGAVIFTGWRLARGLFS